jgi:DNA modification methylase
MGKQNDLRGFVKGFEELKGVALGPEQEKFLYDPSYAKWRQRMAEIKTLESISQDIFTTVVPMKHSREDRFVQNIISAGVSKELTVKETGRNKSDARNIGAMKKKVIVDGTNVRVSSFPVEITKGFVYFFTDKGATVLDPFSGHNSRMSAVIQAGRNYIGYDVAKKYVEDIQKEYENMKHSAQTLGKQIPNMTIHWASSEKMLEEDNSVDFVFSSPPFWKKEFYDNDPRQLGVGDYDDFLEKLGGVFKECYRVLKEHKFIGMHVEDLRMNDELITFGADTQYLLKKAGFRITNVAVTPYNNVQKSFKLEKLLYQYLGKAHGYIILGRKGTKENSDNLGFEDEEDIENI